MFIARWSLACLCLGASTAVASPQADRPAQLVDRARTHLQSGDLERGREALESALEYRNEDLELLELASRTSMDLGDRDLGAWYAQLAVDQARRTGRDSAVDRRTKDLLAEAGGDEFRARFDAHAAAFYDLGRKCARRRLYANAVDLFLRCRDTRFASKARAELEKLGSNKKAASALLRAGFDLGHSRVSEREFKRLKARDEAHSDWGNAYRDKTQNYTVVTNMGYRAFQDTMTAMEQLHHQYRQIFGFKGRTTQCTIRIYRSRTDFDANEGRRDPAVRGFYVPTKNLVVTYDPRTDNPPRPLSALWSTLFHEASHQFTREISSGLIPGWLNEGTATYFEGTRLLPNGTLETNGIPESRLRALRTILAKGTPSLMDVISYYQPGSYPGNYYPVGWGLVYFLHNYENEAGEQIYRPVYRKYLQSYRRVDRHSPIARFEEFFVKEADDPQVRSLADFEQRFRGWIEELHDDYFGPPERSIRWLLLARSRVQRGEIEEARDHYLQALRKSPGDITARFELADLFKELGDKDASLLELRRVIEHARRRSPTEAVPGMDATTSADLIDTALARMHKVDHALASALEEALTDLTQGAQDLAEHYDHNGYPRLALQTIRAAGSFIGRDCNLEKLDAHIRKESGVHIERWRQILPDQLSGWVGDSTNCTLEDDVLHWKFQPPTTSTEVEFDYRILLLEEALLGDYAVDVEVKSVQGDDGRHCRLLGLAFAARTAEDFRSVNFLPFNTVDLARHSSSWERVRVQTAPRRTGDWVRIGVEVQGDVIRVLQDDKVVLTRPRTADTAGAVGLLIGEGHASFRNLRVRIQR